MLSVGRYLKQHTEDLVKDVGVEAACGLTGKSKATLGRYYASHEEHASRFMPIDAVARLEQAASYPFVTGALAELSGHALEQDTRRPNLPKTGGINADVIALSQRFAILMAEYNQSMADGQITLSEARRLQKETVALQQVLIDMKFHLDGLYPDD